MTAHRPEDHVPFDVNANKTVIYVSHRRTGLHQAALVSIGYSGLAYIGNKPTDHWIAEILNGEELPDDFSLHTRPYPDSWPDLGQRIERLRSALEKAFRALPRRERRHAHMEIGISGWSTDSKTLNAKPVLWTIEPDRSRGLGAFKIDRYTRNWAWHAPTRQGARVQYVGSTIPKGQVSGGQMRRMKERLGQCFDLLGADSKQKAADMFEIGLIETLLDVASSTRAIGTDALSVRIDVTSRPHGQVKYLQRSATSPIAFTPWVVSPTVVMRPSQFAGSDGMTSFTVHCGDIDVRFEAPLAFRHDGNGSIGWLGSYQRPPKPGSSG